MRSGRRRRRSDFQQARILYRKRGSTHKSTRSTSPPLTRYIDVLARIGASKRADNETAAHGVFRHVRALARVLGAYVVSLDRLLRERDAVARQLDGKRRRAENDALDADDDVANRRLSKGNIRTN